MKRNLLLVNPWIYDFAAYDLWMKPLGLLYIASFLRNHGYTITFLDCLDRFEPQLLQYNYVPKSDRYGCGAYYREEVEKPKPYKHIRRKYKRYGIPIRIFLDKLKSNPKPDAILITSGMTYWYLGVFLAVELLRKQFPDVPIVLGGIYATLCYEHAKEHSGAHYIFRGRKLEELLKLLNKLTGNAPHEELHKLSYPAYDLTKTLYACLLTSYGCPYRCSYCASALLYPEFTQRPPGEVVDEIEHLYRRYQIRNFAFYDDALLQNSKNHICSILEEVIKRKIRCNFHTPNGLHARYIDEEVATLLHASGFKTLRLSFETVNVDWKRRTGDKVTNEELKMAISNLKQAGFKGKEIGVYVMVGLPEQSPEEVVESILYVASCGAWVKLSEYSPIPGTPDFELIKKILGWSEDHDPLLHNNSTFLLEEETFNFDTLQNLKKLVRIANYAVELGIGYLTSSSLGGIIRKSLRKGNV
jgi:pyruvate-formate lyase-activating enzyme